MNEWPLPHELPDPNAAKTLPEPVPQPLEAFPFWGYQDLMFVAGLFFLALIVLGGAAFLFSSMLPGVLTLVLTQAFLYGAGLISLYAVISIRYGRHFADAMRWAASASALRAGALAGFGTAVVGSLLAAALGAQNMDDMPMQAMLSSRALVGVVGVMAVTIGPLWEELTFRGFLLPLFAKGMGTVAAILLTACLFASMHGPQYGWAWQALVPVGFAGACFGVARVISGSTGVAVAMHAIYNLTIFVGFLAQGGLEKLP